MHVKRAAETRTIAVDLSHKLAVGELLSGTPTVTEIGSSALTISGVELSSVERVIGSRPALTSRAVLFTVSGGVAGTDYVLRLTVGSNATAAQTLVEQFVLRVI